MSDAAFVDNAFQVARVGLASGIALHVVVVCSHFSECATVSCATDTDEFTDRLSSGGLTVIACCHGLIALRTRKAPLLHIMNVAAILGLAIFSDEVAEFTHVVAALAFYAAGLMLMFVDNDVFDLLSLLFGVVCRGSLLVWTVSYACSSVHSFCPPLATRTLLPRPVALMLQSLVGLILLGGPLLTTTGGRRVWQSDLLTLASFPTAALGNVVLGIVRPSLVGSGALAVICALDLAFFQRLWANRSSALFSRPEGLVLSSLMLGPTVFALVA